MNKKHKNMFLYIHKTHKFYVFNIYEPNVDIGSKTVNVDAGSTTQAQSYRKGYLLEALRKTSEESRNATA